MNKLSFLPLAGLLGAVAAGAHADDYFVGLTLGETTNNMERSASLHRSMGEPKKWDDVIRNSGTWGLRVGRSTEESRHYVTYEYVSDDYHRALKLRQHNLLGSHDMFLPVDTFIPGATSRLFGGATLGLTKLEQNSPGLDRDSDIGYMVGLQAGILQPVADLLSLEAGFRYLRSNASTEIKEHGGRKLGSIDLHSSKQAYLGVNYHF